MQPIVDGLQTRFEAQIAFDAIDAATESGSKTLAVYGLRGHPSYLILDTGGALLWSFSGQISEPNLEQQLDKYSQ